MISGEDNENGKSTTIGLISKTQLCKYSTLISYRHLEHSADKCTCAWEFKKPFIFCFITLRWIQAKIN